ncbi:MAG TPA: wax ester/triacylglycerol synthase family O-acyltransferase [Acidimicrobiales bacterium]
MQRLTGADATFLYGQTARAPMEVCSVVVIDPSTASHEFDYERSLEWLSSRLHMAPPLRRRLVKVPLELDHPVWIEDPDFDLEYHFRRAALPAPGAMGELGDFVAQILSRPLDLTRPLWEMHLVEGLVGGRVATVTKAHHAAVDGVAGMEMFASLVDLSPDAQPPPAPESPWEPDVVPTQIELVASAMGNFLLQPVRGAKAARRLVRGVIDTRRRGGNLTEALGGARDVPVTRFNQPVSPHRRVRFFDLGLTETKKIKDTAGVMLNDVVLAAVGGGLRSYLIRHSELPDIPLKAFVPLSTREDPAAADGGNETSLIFVTLATDVDDPLKRLEVIAEASRTAKAAHRESGPPPLTDLSELTGSAAAAMTGRIMDRTRLNARVRLGGNVVVSNIPGAPIPLYVDGARVENVYPLGPLTDGNGLNITLFSYQDTLGFGVVACRDQVPDIDVLVSDIRAAYLDIRDASKVS